MHEEAVCDMLGGMRWFLKVRLLLLHTRVLTSAKAVPEPELRLADSIYRNIQDNDSASGSNSAESGGIGPAESGESDSAESGDSDPAENYCGVNGNGDSDGGQQPLEVGAIF